MESKLPKTDSSQVQLDAMAEDLGIIEQIMSSNSEEYMSSFAYPKQHNDATNMKESQIDSRQSDLDALVPGLEDSSLDTDASEEVVNELAENKRTVGTSTRKHAESLGDEELSAPPESSGDSIVTDLVANTSLVGSSRRSKSGAGMFSKSPVRSPNAPVSVRVHESPAREPDSPVRVNKSKGELDLVKPSRVPKESASHSKGVPVKPRPYQRPKDLTSNYEDVQVRPRKLSKDSTKRTKNSYRRGQATAAAKGASVATTAKAKRRDVNRKKKQEVVDDDSTDYSGSVSTGTMGSSTMGSTGEDLVSAFMDFIDLDLDPFEEENPFENEQHSVNSATGSIDSEGSTYLGLAREALPGAAKTEETSYICNDHGSFEGLCEYIGLAGILEKDTEETVEDVQPVSPKPEKSKYSQKIEEVEDKVTPDESVNIGAVADSSKSSPALGLADFLDASFFIDLWKEVFPPKNNTEMAPKATKSADQKSPSDKQESIDLSLGDTEAETLFDDLLDEDDSFAGLASILKSTDTALNDLRAQLHNLDGLKDEISIVEQLIESEEKITPHTSLALNESADVTPKVPEKSALEDWQQFSDSPFMADGSRTISTPTRSRQTVSISMEEPILLKRLHSLDAKCSLLTAEFQELTAPVTPDDRDDETELNLIYSASFDEPAPDARRKQKLAFSPPREVLLYPPNDEAFERFETVPTNEKDDLFLCGPARSCF
jgi:hypothetical protein